MKINKTFSRRQFFKIVAVGAVTAGVGVKFGLDQYPQLQTASTTRLLMGTVVNLTIVSDDPQLAQLAIDNCLGRMSNLETVLSRFQSNSQLSQLNQSGSLTEAHPALLNLIGQGQEISQLTGGAFDITVKPLVDLYQRHQATNTLPSKNDIQRTLTLVDYRKLRVKDHQISFDQPGMAITLDGIAKGYIVDEGVATLHQFGFNNVMVEAGGDLLASGQKSADKPWQIGIQSPRQAMGNLLAKVTLHNKATATSGDYMQPFTTNLSQHHILDPRTGYSAPELAGATVIAPTTVMADGLATAAMVLGPQDGLRLIESLSGCEACLVTKDLRVFNTSAAMTT